MYGEQHDDDVVATVLGSLTGTFAVMATAWLAVLGFVGGTVPGVGLELPGGIGGGLVWLGALGTVGLVVLGVLPLLASMAIYRALTRLLRPALARPARPALRQHPRTRAA